MSEKKNELALTTKDINDALLYLYDGSLNSRIKIDKSGASLKKDSALNEETRDNAKVVLKEVGRVSSTLAKNVVENVTAKVNDGDAKDLISKANTEVNRVVKQSKNLSKRIKNRLKKI